MRSFDMFLVGETHEMPWSVLWAFFNHLDKLGKLMTAHYVFIIGGQFGTGDEPLALVSKPLMVLLHQLGCEAKKAAIPAIEKALIDLPGSSFIFLPVRDSLPGWLFVMTFLRGFNALPEAAKQRHAPFHARIERVPAPVAS
jgi:hypothetical protein